MQGAPTRNPDSVSGALATNLRAVVTELLGEPAVRAALARVPPDARRDFEGVTSIGWIPIASLEAVFGELARGQGQTIAELHENVARISVERTLRTVWRVLLRLTTDAALISRTPVLFARAYNRGKLEARIPTPGRAEVTLSEWPNTPEWTLRATRIGIETVLRVAGRKNVRTVSERRPQGAAFAVTWQ
jgi:hypothetical protein